MTDAYRLCGLPAGSTLQAPSYHCRTMLDPAIRIGVNVVLYPLLADLRPDMAGLADCLARCVQPVRALLVTHYFGFTQALGPLREWRLAHDVKLIEDCSHCLFLPPLSGDLGVRGQYCVASPYKLFPIEDGGLLWANAGAPIPHDPARTSGIGQELRAIARALKGAVARRAPPDAGQTARSLAALPMASAVLAEDRSERQAGPSTHYSVTSERRTSLATTRWIMRHTRLSRLVTQRRANCQAWLRCVDKLSHRRALFPDLPAACVPYMFPLHIKHPKVHFFALKRLGFPIWRWDGITSSGCAFATAYRTQLLHLPCHQELGPAQMRWMTTVLPGLMSSELVEEPA